MENQISFSTIGKDFAHELRDKINNSENIIDLKNNFVYTVINFMNKVFAEEQLSFDADDITFDPNKDEFYLLNDRLLQNQQFKKTWDNSDLKNVIGKFADSVKHRYIHLNKHNEKTNKKIRNP
ncbi:MAG: hypothetical protein K9N07_05995 [Candidatus Cloacimonetes bacterium]|nr:hypothetical protein [Candidatus Cloacimonadota bacterium]